MTNIINEKLKNKENENMKYPRVEYSKNKVTYSRKNIIVGCVLIGVATFIFMLVISAQLNTVGNTDIIADGMREAELLSEIATLKQEHEDLKEKYDQAQEVVEEYKTNASTNDKLISSLTTELQYATALAGLKDVKGEGISMKLYDSTNESSDLNLAAGLVHDTDLTAVLTELKAAGAEAISVNGQRIIATTAIRCVGPTIQIYSVKVSSPFEIKAIGNAQYLESAINIKGGIVDSLRGYGIKIDVFRETDIIIPKYDGSYKLRTATVID